MSHLTDGFQTGHLEINSKEMVDEKLRQKDVQNRLAALFKSL
jgi:hypothetical protein